MNGLELYLLGRRLMKLGEEAIPSAGFRGLPTSVRSVLADVFGHPGTTISGIASRTGFPQSHVSASMVRLRELGVVETGIDPADRRCTLVTPTPGALERAEERGSAPIDATIRKAIGGDVSDQDLARVLEALDVLATALDTPSLTRGSGEESPQLKARES